MFFEKKHYLCNRVSKETRNLLAQFPDELPLRNGIIRALILPIGASTLRRLQNMVVLGCGRPVWEYERSALSLYIRVSADFKKEKISINF